MKLELTRGIFAPAVELLITSIYLSDSIKYWAKCDVIFRVGRYTKISPTAFPLNSAKYTLARYGRNLPNKISFFLNSTPSPSNIVDPSVKTIFHLV